MHFSRNPPGPNTSCIKGSVDSFAVLSAAPCRATPTPVGSSSNCTYSRSAVFAARFTFAPGESPAGLNARFARNPPLLPGRTGETSYDNISVRSAPSAARLERGGDRISLDSGRLRVEHSACLSCTLALFRRVTFASGDFPVRFPFQGWQRRLFCRGGPHESQQRFSLSSCSFARRLDLGCLQRAQNGNCLHRQLWRQRHGCCDHGRGYASCHSCAAHISGNDCIDYVYSGFL